MMALYTSRMSRTLAMPDRVELLIPLSDEHLSELRCHAAVSRGRDIDPTISIVRSNVRVDEDFLRRRRSLHTIIRAGSGTDNIDLIAVQQRCVKLVTNHHLSATSVAELALAATLTLTRRLAQGHGLLRSGNWAKDELIGDRLAELSTVVWGAGPVGRAVYKRLLPACGSVEFVAWPSLPKCLPRISVEQANASADIHMLCVPLRPTTTGAFGAAWLHAVAAMRPYVVNVARFEIFDVASVLDAIGSRHLRGLFVDPVEERHVADIAPLLGRPEVNFVATPHLGAQRTDVQVARGEWVVAAVRQLTRGALA